jgi:Flp pilus assembly protein TadG
MKRLVDSLRRFRKDERGVFMVLFAVLALVLIATSGAVVDFTSVEQSRTRAQTALDAAALALQPRIKTDNTATLKTKAQTIVTERLNDSTITVTVGTPTVNTTEGTLELTATMAKGTSFVRLVGINSITANLVSQATRKQLDLEVVMVLDNSISMNSSNRMTNLKKAARCATNILFNSISACDDTTLNASDSLTPTNTSVRVGIVPFTEFVNVGTSNKTATWMIGTGGNQEVSRDNFDSDDDSATAFSANVNRWGLYTAIGQTWSGCVEARNHTTGTGGLYYDTSDLTPDSTIPDSLFTPVFAPDQPSGYGNNYLSDTPAACPATPIYTQTTVKTKCNTAVTTASQWNSATCSGGTTTTTYSQTVGGVASTSTSTVPSTLLHINKSASSTDTYSNSVVGSGTYKYTITQVKTWTYTPFSDRVLQERLCKYVSGNTVSLGSNFQAGPNADCGVALLPLTTTKSDVISKISAMGPDGGTNIHQGVMWGFHVISPGEPFTQGKAYDSATSKVMIIMTDGENTAGSAGMGSGANNTVTEWTGGDWYLAYSYPYNRRIDASGTMPTSIGGIQTEMNARTMTTCANARAQGIVVYTVGLATSSTSNPTAVTAMLNSCATDPDAEHAFFPANSTDLVTVFQQIAGQLADLRLAK